MSSILKWSGVILAAAESVDCTCPAAIEPLMMMRERESALNEHTGDLLWAELENGLRRIHQSYQRSVKRGTTRLNLVTNSLFLPLLPSLRAFAADRRSFVRA